MQVLKGIPVSSGHAEGITVVYDYEVRPRLEVPRYDVPPAEVRGEEKRLDEAVAQASRELEQAESSARAEFGESEAAGILSAHQQLVREIGPRVRDYIRRESVNVEQAVDAVMSDVVEYLRKLESVPSQEREQDVRDVGGRMLRHLSGRVAWSRVPLPANPVIVARELLPSEALDLAHSGLAAIVTEQGGTSSHTAILARSLGVPAVTGIRDVTVQVRPGLRALVDGTSGEVTVEPSESQATRFAELKRAQTRARAQSAAVEEQPCVTRDGVLISLLANIESLEEVEQVRARNLDGVGLFRTEFLFLESHERPSFEAQAGIYGEVADALEGRPLVIRTFDWGGDKTPPFLASAHQAPHRALSLRGLRFLLAEREILETQLRAIAEVARGRNVRVLFPMVVGSLDLSLAREALERAVRDLGAKECPPVGAMIETPSALFVLDEILESVDFVSIGTNDLIQYMLAVDRDAADLVEECTLCHPSVLRAIKRVVDAAAVRNCPVSVCGEDAGEPTLACLLAGLGVRELSMTPVRAAQVRYALRSISYAEAGDIAAKALACSTPGEVQQVLSEFQFEL